MPTTHGLLDKIKWDRTTILTTTRYKILMFYAHHSRTTGDWTQDKMGQNHNTQNYQIQETCFMPTTYGPLVTGHKIKWDRTTILTTTRYKILMFYAHHSRTTEQDKTGQNHNTHNSQIQETCFMPTTHGPLVTGHKKK